MRNLNSVMIIGRMVADCELRYTNSGTAMESFSIAVSDDYKEQKKSYFFNCKSFNLEKVSQYMKKGMKVAVSGKLVQESWIDRTSGKNMYSVIIMVDSVELCEKPQNNEGNQQSFQQNNQQKVQKTFNTQQAPKMEYPFSPKPLPIQNPWNDEGTSVSTDESDIPY